MTLTIPSVRHLSNRDLLAHVQRAAADERRATAELIALLLEVDSRRLYLGGGCSSLFTYCTQVLHLSEHAAYGRIEAARVETFPDPSGGARGRQAHVDSRQFARAAPDERKRFGCD